MPKRARQEETSADHDSFLDIVSNIVGILIILVVLVGVRAKHAPVTVSIPSNQNKAEESLTDESLKLEEHLRTDILEMKSQGLSLAEEAAVNDRRRRKLAMLVSAAEHGIENKRKQLDEETREQFDLERSLVEKQAQLQAAIRESILAQEEKNSAKPAKLEHHPTPLSHLVKGPEIHLQLRYGRVTVVPIDKLVEEFKDEVERKGYRLKSQRELTGVIGPVDGFRLKYLVERIDVTAEYYQQSVHAGSYLDVSCDFLPVNRRLGETLDEALADGSELRRVLAVHRPDRSTVTMWTYPEAFGDFQRLKKLCYRLGFSVAVRPLPTDAPISASNNGSRSVAQ